MYKKYIEGKKAVFFDLDGTIVKETTELKTKALQKTLNDAGLSYISAEEYSFIGDPFELSWKAILELNNIPDKKSVAEWSDISKNNYLNLVKETNFEITDGFWDLVYELKKEKGFKLALITNSVRDVTDLMIEKLDIQNVFDFVICGDEVRRLKPNPEMLKKAARELKVGKKEIFVFEDSISGAEASGKAGMDTIIIWDGVTPKRKFKGKILDFMTDFTPLPGNLDETDLEYIARGIEEDQKEKAQSTPTTI